MHKCLNLLVIPELLNYRWRWIILVFLSLAALPAQPSSSYLLHNCRQMGQFSSIYSFVIISLNFAFFTTSKHFAVVNRLQYNI